MTNRLAGAIRACDRSPAAPQISSRCSRSARADAPLANQRTWRRIVARAGLAALVLVAGVRSARAAAVEAICDIAFSGSSGLGPWTGSVQPLRVHPVAASTAGRWNALLEIPVASLDDGNKVRDTQMHEMFESKQWPVIRAELRDVDPAEVEKTSRLPVNLTIRDQTKHLDAVVSNWRASDNKTQFEADVVVSLRVFSLQAPMVLGLSQVNDEVRIHARVAVSGLQ